jgi:hypothetical protein
MTVPLLQAAIDLAESMFIRRVGKGASRAVPTIFAVRAVGGHGANAPLPTLRAVH